MQTWLSQPSGFAGGTATLLVMFACAALGSVIGGGRGRLPGSDMTVGIGLATVALTVLSTATRVPVPFWTGMLGLAAIAACAVSARHRRLPGGICLLFVLCLLTPLLRIAAGASATMWDDFWHWLPNAAYLYEQGTLVRPDLPPSFSHWPGYPPTMPFIVAASSWVAGRLLENAGPVANVALLASFAATLADAVCAFQPQPWDSLIGRLCLAAMAAAASSIFNPALDYNVLLSSYADVGTMVAVGVLGVLGASLLKQLDDHQRSEAGGLAWRIGFTAAALIGLKQANPVLLALLFAGFAMVAVRSSPGTAMAAAKLLPAMLAPPLVLFASWRLYVMHDLADAEMTFHPLGEWNFAQLGPMLRAIIEYHIRMPVFFAAMWLIAIVGIVRSTSLRAANGRLLMVAALVWLGYNVFLLVVYLGAMSASEASWAADYFRYTPHVALLALSAVTLRLIGAASEFPARRLLPVLALVCTLLAPGEIIAHSDSISPRSNRWAEYCRAVGHDLAHALPSDARLAIVSTNNQDEMWVSLAYDVLSGGGMDRGLRVAILWQGDDVTSVEDELGGKQPTHLVITDAFGPAQTEFDTLVVPPIRHETALCERSESGWHKVLTWPLPSKN